MAEDGIGRALAFVASAFGSNPAVASMFRPSPRPGGSWPTAPQIDKIRLFYNHPGFIEAMADRVWDALEEIPAERRGDCAADLHRPQHPLGVGLQLLLFGAA